MKQYCRYCCNCFFGDGLICAILQSPINEECAKRVNHCKDFEFNEEDVFNPDHKYTPRVIKPKVDDGQMKFEF